MGRIRTETAAAFAPGGALSQAGLDPREGQAQLALLAAGAVEDHAWAAAHAPCGSGKSLAYLVPGLLAATGPEAMRQNGKRAHLIVSTANIALQDQLRDRDIPLACRALGVEARVATLKGRGNYLCRLRLLEAEAGMMRGKGSDLARAPGVREALAWSQQEGCTGDREDLPPGVDHAAFGRLAASTEECLGEACPHHDGSGAAPLCFAEAARAGRESAHVWLVNHHYLALAPIFGSVLLAVDEAHALEDALRGAHERHLRMPGVRRLASSLCAAGCDRGTVEEGLVQPLQRLLDRVAGLLDGRGTLALAPGWWPGGPVPDGSVVGGILQELDLRRAAAPDDAAVARVEGLMERVKGLQQKGQQACAGGLDGDPVVYATPDGPYGSGVAAVHLACPDARPGLARLAAAHRSALLCSGTLAAGGDFAPALAGLGFRQPAEAPQEGLPEPPDPARCAALASPFPLAAQGILVLPRGPGIRDPAWPAWCADRAVEAAREAGGNTLVLCTSWSAATRIAQALRERTDLPVALQGEAGRRQLAADLRRGGRVLVATRSFFEGLDVPGDALTCVVIDRIPFTPPDDPVEGAAGRLAAQRSGLSPFVARALPRACALLAQAAGRLIRTPTDRGAVVLLDPRVAERDSIGGAVRRALSPYPVTDQVADVGRHLRGEPLAGLAPAPGGGYPGGQEVPWATAAVVAQQRTWRRAAR